MAGTTVDLVLPSVAYAERVRQLARDGKDVARFDRFLDELEIAVEPFDRAETGVAKLVTDDARWARRKLDALIAGHVREGDILWTTDVADFLALDVPPDQVVDPTRA